MRLLDVNVAGIGWRGKAARRFREGIDSDQNGNVGTRVTIGATNSRPARSASVSEGRYDIGALHLATGAIDLLKRNLQAPLRNEDPGPLGDWERICKASSDRRGDRAARTPCRAKTAREEPRSAAVKWKATLCFGRGVRDHLSDLTAQRADRSPAAP